MMVVAPTYGRDAQALLEALGVPVKLRTFDLRMRVGEFVTIETTQFADGPSLDRAARLIVERQYQLFRWVPIGEELPPVGEPVFFVAFGEWHLGSRFTCGENPIFKTIDESLSAQATHWAYPPSLPKPKEGKS